MEFSFILLGAGISGRFNSNIPKQYHKIAGKTLIDISINKVKEFKDIKKIILVYNTKHKKYLKNIKLKNIKLIKGGNSRNESTYNALKYLRKIKNINKVLIHDAARPNFSKKLIKNILKNSKKNKTVIPILKLQDALKEKNKRKKITSLRRDNFFTTQTPQCFSLNEIFWLHKKKMKHYTDDDFSLIAKTNNVKLIAGEKRNFKITNHEDLNLLKKIYKSNIKLGIGFDVHRLIAGRKLYLGGVKIPSNLGTLGHSDGDPVLHAIIDAILGACGMGDIGENFSDKKKKYKNISSSKLIKEVINKIKKKNYIINNIDLNIIAEYPKLKKFKMEITKNIADLCDVSFKDINIKAKTTEKLGVIGQEKAIATEVILSVIKYD
jgi:2-C-methyl-D-erythritol 4-phosphate cytidylyltransferase/2-C-methyl-D-erythritol 2,4-cyclodiphosphate synthase